MPGCNKCQNIHTSYVPHNADGEDGEIACHQDHSAVEEVCCFIHCPEIRIYTDIRPVVNPSMLLEAVRAYKPPKMHKTQTAPPDSLGLRYNWGSRAEDSVLPCQVR